MMIPNSSNYKEDDTPMLLDFNKPYDVVCEDDYALSILSSVVEEASCAAFNVCESSSLCYLAGSAVFKELKTLALLVLKLFLCRMFPRGNFPNRCILVYSRMTAKVILKIPSLLTPIPQIFFFFRHVTCCNC